MAPEALRLETDLTRRLGCQFPILLPPMAGAGGWELATQVSLGGGFGFIGTGKTPSLPKLSELELELNSIRQTLSSKNLSLEDRLPIGYGFLCWRLDAIRMEDRTSQVEEYLAKVIEQVKCVWLSFGENLLEWITLIDGMRSRSVSKTKCLIAIQTVNEAQARELVEQAPGMVDVIIAQGSEAGGHGAIEGLPITSFVPLMSEIIDSRVRGPTDFKPLLVAAGGLVNGRHLTAMLALGAAGIACGTRFLLTHESKYTIEQKNALLSAKSGETVRSVVFDRLNQKGDVGWPSGVDARSLKNKTTSDFLEEKSYDRIKADYTVAIDKKDLTRTATWSGTSIGSVSQIKPAQEIVSEIAVEAIKTIKAIHNLLPTNTTDPSSVCKV